jgi:Ca2+-binding EF-hand superfamily protein
MKRLRAEIISAPILGFLTCVALGQPANPGGGGPFGPPPGQGGPPQGPGGERGRFHPPPPPLMKALDANHDGELSADEIANAVAALKTLDKNGDGKLTRDELRPAFAGPNAKGGFGPMRQEGRRGPNAEGFIQRLMSHDKDGDGKVSKSELPEPMQRIIDRGDTNGDGAIDEAEAKALVEEHRPRRGGPARGGAACPPGGPVEGQPQQ